MPPPMSALITAKDANDDLVEVVLFEKFNDLRGFGRRLFLPFDQAGYLYFCLDEFRNVKLYPRIYRITRIAYFLWYYNSEY